MNKTKATEAFRVASENAAISAALHQRASQIYKRTVGITGRVA
ncbi:hypothetical protein [Microcoleus sp. FACHB-SPT15]|nr:hypothetical protein [Microcoleus sp. FACHB-SPT15]